MEHSSCLRVRAIAQAAHGLILVSGSMAVLLYTYVHPLGCVFFMAGWGLFSLFTATANHKSYLRNIGIIVDESKGS